MYRSGLYTGIKYEFKQITNDLGLPLVVNIAALDQFVNARTASNQDDSIVSIFMIPHAFGSGGGDDYPENPKYSQYTINRPTSLDGYTPRNQKLLTYPYNFLTVDGLNDSKNYRYELSKWNANTGQIRLEAGSVISPNPEIIVCPISYNTDIPESGGLPTAPRNPTEALYVTGFPQCPITIDAYRAWLAQQSGAQTISMIGSLVGIGAAAATGNIPGVLLGGVGLASSLNSSVVESSKGNRVRGGTGGSADVATHVKGIYAKKMCVTSAFAQMIDAYFDRYGYAVNSIAAPNPQTRRTWTYFKTSGASITGTAPAEAIRKIKQIFDNGVTFWNMSDGTGSNGVTPGDYSQNNLAYVR